MHASHGDSSETVAQDALRPRIRSAAAAPSASASASSRARGFFGFSLQLRRGGGDLRVGFGARLRHELPCARRARRGASRPSACRSRRARRVVFCSNSAARRAPGSRNARPARAPSASPALARSMTRSSGLKQQPVDDDRQQQDEEDDPEDRQIREHVTASEARWTFSRHYSDDTKRQFIPFDGRGCATTACAQHGTNLPPAIDLTRERD